MPPDGADQLPGPLSPLKAANPRSSRMRRLLRLLNTSREKQAACCPWLVRPPSDAFRRLGFSLTQEQGIAGFRTVEDLVEKETL